MQPPSGCSLTPPVAVPRCRPPAPGPTKIDREAFGKFFDGTPGKSWDDYASRLKNAAAGEVDDRGYSLADEFEGVRAFAAEHHAPDHGGKRTPLPFNAPQLSGVIRVDALPFCQLEREHINVFFIVEDRRTISGLRFNRASRIRGSVRAYSAMAAVP